MSLTNRSLTHALRTAFAPAVLVLGQVSALGATPAHAVTTAAGGALPGILQFDWRVHDVGNVRTLVTNWGLVGSRPGSNVEYSFYPSAEWPAGTGVEHLWASGVWIGALRDGAPHVTTAAFVAELRPGADVLDRLYATYDGAPGGARAPSPQADDDGDGRVDEDRLNGRDDDGDGLADEDFAGISDQMFTGECRDTLAVGGHAPLGVRLEQSTLVWSDPRLDDLVGLDTRVVNEAASPLDGLYVGFFADCDIGHRTDERTAEDDRAGFWEGDVTADLGDGPRIARVTVAYTFDLGGTGSHAGLVYLGAARPGEGTLPLGVTNFRMFSGRSSYAAGGDPTQDSERYEVLAGTDPHALPPPDPETGLRPPQVASRDDDYRILLAAGPFGTLPPGGSASLRVAFVFGHDFDEMLLHAANAKLLYENDWRPRGPVGVEVQDLEARSGAGGVHLAWRLLDHGAVRAVSVQRAFDAEGPWGEAVATLVPAEEMSWDDGAVEPGHAYWYRLAIDGGGADGFVSAPVGVVFDSDGGRPLALAVPVVTEDGSVSIGYSLTRAGFVQIEVYDLRGRRVATVLRDRRQPGMHSATWDRRDSRGELVARGLYVVRAASAGASVARKIVLSR